MAERVVIDASVALAHLLDETGTAAAQDAFARWTRSGTQLLVPSHFWVEVLNSLVRRHRRPARHVIEDLVNLDRLGLRTIEPDRPLLLLAMDRMVDAGLSSYDAIYLALALATGSQLATFDRRLATAAGDLGRLIGPDQPHRVADSPVAYGQTTEDYTGWAHSAIVGAHIADVRRRVLAGTLD
ncbi:MAG: type II toxin-antitoxin system VapC family toxin [Chloroflexota bacterium]|nr:type II toxin-antitoxin system VapC family toxin [Chloroflexota bacterium]